MFPEAPRVKLSSTKCGCEGRGEREVCPELEELEIILVDLDCSVRRVDVSVEGLVHVRVINLVMM